MCTVLEHDTLEIPKVDYTSDAKKNMRAIALSAITHVDNTDVVSLHPSCTHPASVPCGSRHHRGSGSGWCFYCKTCNPK